MTISPADLTLIVIAKEPAPGRSKTRLCPPLRSPEAAAIAEAALADTLETVASTPARRRLLALDGRPGRWLPSGFEVVPQVGGGLDARLAGAFDAAAAPALLVGMDTPQLTVELLSTAALALCGEGVEAVIGPADDGGYWAIGLRRPRRDAFIGVPMSVPDTAAAQRRRLSALGLHPTEVETLRDVDTIADAEAVAALCPDSRFAAALRSMRWATAT